MGENSSTMKIRAFVIRLISSGLLIAMAIPKPTEMAMSAHTRVPGTIRGEISSRTPYRHEATVRASTAPGRDSTVNNRNLATARALRGTGRDQVKSNVPASFSWPTLAGTRTNPMGIRARAGVPVVMYRAVW